MKEIIKLWDERKQYYKSILKPKYMEYTKIVSNRAMTASLDTCIFLLALYEYTKANDILDMGSGFSSFALRTFKQLQNLDTNIISVDTSEFWLNKTRKFCSKNKLIDDNFELWDNFKNTDKQFDLIFFDMDANRNRPLYFPIIFEQLSRFGCLVLVDDLHKPGMKKGLKKYLETNKIGNFDIKNQTLDSLNRFSTLLRVFR